MKGVLLASCNSLVSFTESPTWGRQYPMHGNPHKIPSWHKAVPFLMRSQPSWIGLYLVYSSTLSAPRNAAMAGFWCVLPRHHHWFDFHSTSIKLWSSAVATCSSVMPSQIPRKSVIASRLCSSLDIAHFFLAYSFQIVYNCLYELFALIVKLIKAFLTMTYCTYQLQLPHCADLICLALVNQALTFKTKLEW